MKNLHLILTTGALFIFSLLPAQNDKSKINKIKWKKHGPVFGKAENGKYPEAIDALREAIQRDAKFIDAYLSLAGVYGEVKNYGESIRYYEQAFAIDSNYSSGYRLPYSINLAGLGEFEKALNTINTLLARKDLHELTQEGIINQEPDERPVSFQIAMVH